MSKFSKLKAGEVLSESQHYVVNHINGNTVSLQPDNGDEISVNSAYVEAMLTSGEQFSTEQKINKTDAAALFLANPYVAMTVNFQKQVKPEDVSKEILDAYEVSSPRVFKEAVNKALKHGLRGEERTIVGRHNGHVDEMGRAQFIDMKLKRTTGKEYDDRQRLVDPRTINYMILRDIKYTVK